MHAAARSKLCSSVSAWLGVFARIAMSSASVIVFAGYLLLFFLHQLNGFNYCYIITIQLNINRLFALGLNVKQFYLIH